jgi:hypothetical protein
MVSWRSLVSSRIIRMYAPRRSVKAAFDAEAPLAMEASQRQS